MVRYREEQAILFDAMAPWLRECVCQPYVALSPKFGIPGRASWMELANELGIPDRHKCPKLDHDRAEQRAYREACCSLGGGVTWIPCWSLPRYA